jgi:S1-C subfamily serine protease
MDVNDSPKVPPRMIEHERHSLLWLAFALLMLALGLVWQYWPQKDRGVNADAVMRAVTARGDLAEEEKTTISIFRETSPSVVQITTSDLVRHDLFSLNVLKIPKGTGSGFIWDSEGHIVTNYHVVQEAGSNQVIEVMLANHSSPFKARRVGAYPGKDLAVLYIDAPKELLRPLAIGTSADLQVGQKVFAIGNPFGLDQSLTTGIISALGREIDTPAGQRVRDLIQTDAAINPGNSGGPLLDSAGRLIGVNAMIASTSNTFSGIGFAIPVDEVNRIVPQLIRDGKVVRPWLGIHFAPDHMTHSWGLRGVLIWEVQPDGPAEKAGLRATQLDGYRVQELGDVIIAINGKRVTSGKEMVAALNGSEVGTTVTVTVLRNGDQLDVPVTLENIPQQ